MTEIRSAQWLKMVAHESKFPPHPPARGHARRLLKGQRRRGVRVKT